MTYLQVVQDAMASIGWYSKGRQLDGHDKAYALRAIQRLLGLWSDKGWLTVAPIWRNFQLTANQNNFTVGESGSPDSSDPRPTKILEAFIRNSDNDNHLSIIDSAKWAREFSKTAVSRPTELYYDPTIPNGTIYFNSKVASSSDYLHYLAEEPYTEPTKLSEDITASPAVRHALFCRLRLDFAPKKDVPIDPVWATDWLDAQNTIKTRAGANRTTTTVSDLAAGRGKRDILTDYR